MMGFVVTTASSGFFGFLFINWPLLSSRLTDQFAPSKNWHYVAYWKQKYTDTDSIIGQERANWSV